MGWVASRCPLGRMRGAALVVAGVAALAAMLAPGRGAAGGSETTGRAANAEVMIITRGALEGSLAPSG